MNLIKNLLMKTNQGLLHQTVTQTLKSMKKQSEKCLENVLYEHSCFIKQLNIQYTSDAFNVLKQNECN